MSKKELFMPGEIRDKVSQLQQEIINLVNKQIGHKEAMERIDALIAQTKKESKGQVVNYETELSGHQKELKAIYLLMKEKTTELKQYENPIQVKEKK